MRRLSDRIELYLKNLITNSKNGIVEVQRSSLAQHFSCVPSQITYVLGTRFTLERGYRVESQRGGGGYLRIERVTVDSLDHMLEILSKIQGGVSQRSALNVIARLEEDQVITPREAMLMNSVLHSSSSVDPEQENAFREGLLRAMVMALMKRV